MSRARYQGNTSMAEQGKESSGSGSVQKLLELHERVKSSGCVNYRGVRVPVRSLWNVHCMEQALRNYEDNMVVTFCKFGWPIGWMGYEIRGVPEVRNHRGATEYSAQLDQYIARKGHYSALFGRTRLCHPSWYPCLTRLIRETALTLGLLWI